jgi:aminocarboxymuconate-semialdehyde decarboxylase
MALCGGRKGRRLTVVDVHAHVIVRGLGAEVRWDEQGQVVELDGRQVRSAVREFVDLPTILAEQDASGVDVVVLCPFVGLVDREPERQNEALAGLVSDRVAVLGTCPVDRPELLRELMADGRLRGVEIAASSDGDYPGHERFRDFWAAADETGAVVFIHPTTRAFTQPVFGEHHLFNLVGNPMETTVAAAHMVLNGVMDAHPGLKVVLAHGGGAITTLRGRIRHAQTFKPPGIDVLAAVKRFYFDTVVFDAGVLQALVDFAGADRVLLGSDYPFDMSDPRPAEIVRALGLPPEDEAAMLGGNALRLLHG